MKKYFKRMSSIQAIDLIGALACAGPASVPAESTDIIVKAEVKATTLDKNALKTYFWERPPIGRADKP